MLLLLCLWTQIVHKREDASNDCALPDAQWSVTENPTFANSRTHECTHTHTHVHTHTQRAHSFNLFDCTVRYDYNNPNDANNYCGGDFGLAADDEDDDDDDVGGFGDDLGSSAWGNQGDIDMSRLNASSLPQNTSNILGGLEMKVPAKLNLIDEPTKAQKVYKCPHLELCVRVCVCVCVCE